MKIRLFPYQLAYQHPFRIAHTVREHTDILYIQLTDEDTEGWGEAVFPPYVLEKRNESSLFFEQISLPIFKNTQEVFSFLTDFIDKNKAKNPAKCAALEMAILRFWAQKSTQKITDLLVVEPVKKDISVTLSISSKEVLKQKIEEHSTASYFKLKVDEHSIESMIQNYLSFCDKPFVIDANQGFQNKEKALFWAKEMNQLKVAYFEQPFHKEDLESHLWLKSHEILPIIADESFQNYDDSPKILNAFDGVNIKLMKCGGVLEAKKIAQLFKKQDKKVLLGCMSDSSISIEMANLLSNEVDFLDLDGPLLMKNDPVLHHQIDIYQKGMFEKFLDSDSNLQNL